MVGSGLEVARLSTGRAGPAARRTIFIVLETELPGVLADHLDIGPAKPGKPLPGHFAERGREVNQIHAGEELGHVDEVGHGLDIEARAAAHLRLMLGSIAERVWMDGKPHVNPNSLPPRAPILLLGLGSELCGGERQHVLAAFEKRLPGYIVLLAVSAVSFFWARRLRRDDVRHQLGRRKTTPGHSAGCQRQHATAVSGSTSSRRARTT